MRPFACPQKPTELFPETSVTVHTPTLLESRMGEGDGKEKLEKTHVLGSQQVWNLHWVSHGREFRWCILSAAIVTKNSSGKHLGFPSSFWGVLNQIIWNVPVSRTTDNPLWLCNSQTLGRATSQRAAGHYAQFLLRFHTRGLSLDPVPSQDFRFPLWHNHVHSSIRGWCELSRGWSSRSERQKPREGLPNLLSNFFPTQDNSTQLSLQWECSCRAVSKLGL